MTLEIYVVRLWKNIPFIFILVDPKQDEGQNNVYNGSKKKCFFGTPGTKTFLIDLGKTKNVPFN